MTESLLLRFSTRRKYSETPTLPAAARYSRKQGYWLLNGKPLVTTEAFLRKQGTKKCDQETGEDMKGE